MNRLFVTSLIVLLLASCSLKELNHIKFNVSKDTMIDSLKTATVLLNKMDFGNGAICYFNDGKIYYTKKESGYNEIVMTNYDFTTAPIIEPLNQTDSNRLIRLIYFLNENGIHLIGKSPHGFYGFSYKQKTLNPTNDYHLSRDIIFTNEPMNSITRKFIETQVVIERYKNLLLIAPLGYDGQKLPLDEKSIMERAKKSIDEAVKMGKQIDSLKKK